MAQEPPHEPALEIADYALLSDCQSVALVSRWGSLDWWCTPRIDSDACFARLLDLDRGGRCLLAPTGEVVGVQRRYLGASMVLETVFETDEGTLRVHDALVIDGDPARPGARRLVRRATCDRGEVEVQAVVSPRFDFGLIPPQLDDHGGGWLTAVGGCHGLAIGSELDLEIHDRHDLRGQRRLAAGESATLVLCSHPPEALDDGPPDRPSPAEAEAWLDATRAWWEEWTERAEGSEVPLDEHAERSALVLRSLVYAPTGAIAAAATTSLPEVPGGAWNWDYRLSWIRDSWMTTRSLALLGHRTEAEAFQRFIQRSAADQADRLQVLFAVDGRHRTPEIDLHDLAGFAGSQPVRIGNAAQEQLQLDMYGYLLELAWESRRAGNEIDEGAWRFLVEVVDLVCERWSQPDHGIWELRGDPQHYVLSKVLCWSALQRGLALAEERDGDKSAADLERWRASSDGVRAAVERGGVGSRGAFVATLDGEEIDASLLLVPEFGFVAPDDPRMGATVDAVIDVLDEGGLIRRFRHDDESAGEGTFVACTFWLVERLIGLGRRDEAEAYFARAAATANDLGLFAEEYDTAHRRMLGNFPQAFSHLAHLGAHHALHGRGPH